VYNVLKAFSNYDKVIGYCQGMSPVAALLCMHMEQEDAFWVLVKLAEKYDMSAIWRPGLPGNSNTFHSSIVTEYKCRVIKMLLCTQKVIEEVPPQSLFTSRKNLLLRNFISFISQKQEKLHSSMYATSWFITLYLHNFSFMEVCIQ
jgi:hypothetical protein